MPQVSEQKQLELDWSEGEFPAEFRRAVGTAPGRSDDGRAESLPESGCQEGNQPEMEAWDRCSPSLMDGSESLAAAAPNRLLTSLAVPVLSLCQKVAERIRKSSVESGVSDNQVSALQRRVRGLNLDFSSPHEDTGGSYRWPGNRLTDSDMRKLRVLSNLTGIPSNELIHQAVGILFAQVRDVMNEAVSVHAQSAASLEELLNLWIADDPTAMGNTPPHRSPHVDTGNSSGRPNTHSTQHLKSQDGLPQGNAIGSLLAAETAGRSESKGSSSDPGCSEFCLPGNEEAMRKLFVAAASGVPVRFVGPPALVSIFCSLTGSLGVEVRTDEQYRDLVIPVFEFEHAQQESVASDAETAINQMQRQLAMMSKDTPTAFREGARAVLGANIRTEHLDDRLQLLVISIAAGIARLEGESEIYADHMAEAVNCVLAGEPKPAPVTLPRDCPPLVRPDRQLTYGGIHHWEWPDPPQEPDTITVDRLRADIDGPPHRFVIRVGDTVEVCLSRSQAELGQVVAVCGRTRRVSVRFIDQQDGMWISLGNIYPASSTKESQRNLRSGP